MTISPITLWDSVHPAPGGSNFSKREGRRNGFKGYDEPWIRKPSFSACRESSESDSETEYSIADSVKQVKNLPVVCRKPEELDTSLPESSIEASKLLYDLSRCIHYMPGFTRPDINVKQRPWGAETLNNLLKTGAIEDIYRFVEQKGFKKLSTLLSHNCLEKLTREQPLFNRNDIAERLFSSLLITVSLYEKKELVPFKALLEELIFNLCKWQTASPLSDKYCKMKHASLSLSNQVFEAIVSSNMKLYDKKTIQLLESLFVKKVKKKANIIKASASEQSKFLNRDEAIKSLAKRKGHEFFIHENNKILGSADHIKYIYYKSRDLELIG